MIAKTPRFVGQQLSYRFNNGVPNQLTQGIGATLTSNRTVPHAVLRPGPVDAGSADAAGRPALRARASFFPEGENGSSRLISSGRRSSSRARKACAATTTSRRAWAAPYDLFGNGKTAHQGEPEQVPAGRLQRRRLHDRQPGGDAGRRPRGGATRGLGIDNDFVADCDYMNPAGQRRVPGVGQSELGSARADDHRESRNAGGLGRSQLGLAVQRRRPAGNRAAGIGGRELQPPVVGQLLRHAQPRARPRTGTK